MAVTSFSSGPSSSCRSASTSKPWVSESEALGDVAFAIFDHRDAGCAGLGQGAGAFRAPKPAAAVLRLKRPLLVVSALAAVPHHKEIVDEAEHRARIGVHRDDRMKRQARPFASTRSAEVS